MLYIHIPFCKSKCIYCDFYSGGNPDWDAYFGALIKEFKQREKELTDFSSVYIGGGTPSLIPETYFKKLVETISSNFSSDAEFTLEINPEDVTDEKALIWKEAGVNRVSMGVQSLDDEELRFFNRRHSSVKAIDSYYILKKYFNNISLDIIYGVPDFTELRRPINVLNSRHTMGIERLRSTLERFIALRPNHISAYALTFEGKTPLQLMADRNRISPVSDEEYKRQGELIFNMLTEAGYERYEVSNFALPGYSSRHNSGYWSGISYLGLGPSASSYDGIRIRRTNPAHLKGYLRHFTEPTSAPFFEEEILSDDELAEERIFLSMRTTKGLDLQMFEIDFGYPRFACLTKGIEKWLKSGDIIVADNYLRFSSQGFWISDYIISELISSW